MSGGHNSEYAVQLTVGKQSRDCEVVVEALLPTAGGSQTARFRVVVGDVEAVVEARRFDERGNVASWSLIDSDGRQRIFDVDGSLPNLRVSVAGGEPIAAVVHDRRSLFAASTSASANSSGELRAAMPGKVVKLLCQVGDSVKAGQGLVVIEAMKMENELRAPTAGKVLVLGVREGQNVESGQSLVTLEPA